MVPAKPEPDPIIAKYVAEVSVPGVPWISTSHHELARLYSKYGQGRVIMLLNEHWANMREYAVALKRGYAHQRCEDATR
jgi:hypothetical protein